jgi:hypothetical protein
LHVLVEASACASSDRAGFVDSIVERSPGEPLASDPRRDGCRRGGRVLWAQSARFGERTHSGKAPAALPQASNGFVPQASNGFVRVGRPSMLTEMLR